MRYQDELLNLYPGADVATRRYILHEVASLPIRFDSEEIEQLLDRAGDDPESEVRAHGLRSWRRIGPGLTRYAYGLHGDRLGLWSMLGMETREGGAPVTAGEDPGEPDPGQGDALPELLGPCAERILELARDPGPEGDRAREILGVVAFEGAEAILGEGALEPDRAVTALLSLAQTDPKLAAAVLAGAGRLPLWIRALAGGAIGGKAATDTCREALGGDDERARWTAALGLASLPGAARVEVATKLLEAAHGWVRVAVLDSLGPAATGQTPGDPDTMRKLLRLLDRGLKQAGHDLVRIAALRALSAIRHELPARRARRCLERGSPLLQAAAIEALVRLKVECERDRVLLLERMRAGPAKLRATAVLGLIRLDRDAALHGAVGLIRSARPAERVEGTYCLGYLQSRTSLRLLEVVASRDPFPPAALQAVKSLSNYPEPEAGPLLVNLLEHPSAEVALGALKVLSHFSGETLPDLVPRLEALERRLPADLRRGMLRQVGRLGPRVSGLDGYLARPREEALALAGALEGLARHGTLSDPWIVRCSRSDDPSVAVPATLARLLVGDRAAASGLAGWLDREGGAGRALTAIREVALLAPMAGRAGRLGAFQDLLRGKRRVRRMLRDSHSAPVVRTTGPEPVRARDHPKLLKEILGVDATELLAAVTQELETLRATPDRNDESRWALDVTYIQSRGLELLEGAGSLTWLPAPVRPYAWLLLVPVLLAVPVGLMWIRSPDDPDGTAAGLQSPLPPGAMRVVDLRGEGRRLLVSGPAGPLERRSAVAPGEGLATGPGSEAMLSDGAGNSVWLGAGSRIVLGDPKSEDVASEEPQWLLKDPDGDLILDFRKARAIEVVVGPDRLILGGSTVRLARTPSGRRVSVSAGSVRIVSPVTPSRHVAEGASLVLGGP